MFNKTKEKDLKFICAQPDDTYYTWQVHLWLESLKNIGHSDKAIVLIFTPKGRVRNDKWRKIINLYPESEFNFFDDEDGKLNPMLRIYIPVLRPYILSRYFKDNPEMCNKALFYCDSDILFLKDFKLDKFIKNDICYLSDTNSYISSNYFDSKVKDVIPEKLAEYNKRDILSELTTLIGINRDIAETNVNNSGGAQYLLKNIDSFFWDKVMEDCITIRTYLQKVNREFFKNENKGFQSWCADMWAVLWNLWMKEQETKVVPELTFAWASDPISKLKKTNILHNAGIVSNNMGYPCFYKGDYHLGKDPTKDKHLDVILNNNESKKSCTWYYTNKLKELSNKYKLKY
jgi:hypothetical protein